MIRAVGLAVVGFMLLGRGLAAADEAGAKACAAVLPPEAKAIYDASAPEFASAPDPVELVKGKVLALIKAGTVQFLSARASATAAGECLKQLR